MSLHLGLDCSSFAIHGVIVLAEDNDLDVISIFKFKSNGATAADRFIEILTQFRDFIEAKPFSFNTVAVENVIFIQNAFTTIGIARVVSGIQLILAWNGIKYSVCQPTSWKKLVLGKGSLKKPEIREWVKTNHSSIFRTLDTEQDFLDAFCIALYGKEKEKNEEGRKTISSTSNKKVRRTKGKAPR